MRIRSAILSLRIRAVWTFNVTGQIGPTIVNEFTFLGTIVYITWSTAAFIGTDILKTFTKTESAKNVKILNFLELFNFCGGFSKSQKSLDHIIRIYIIFIWRLLLNDFL